MTKTNMKSNKTRCNECEKEIDKNDAFFLSFAEMIDPYTGAIEEAGNGFCLKCYRQKAQKISQMHTANAQIHN
jgi:nitrate/TMAO reductase-like tetraheme cytochrome c subunit